MARKLTSESKEKALKAVVKNPKAEIVESVVGYDFKGIGKFKMVETKLKVELHQGGHIINPRVYFDRGPAVAILPYDPDRDEVVLISEARIGLAAAGLDAYKPQVSAGMIDKGETAYDAGIREGREEMGASFRLFKIFNEGAFVSPGGTNEYIALGVAIVDSSKIINGSVHGEVKEGENIKIVKMKAKKFINDALKGKINDMKTLTCAFWLALNRDDLQKKYSIGKSPKGTSPKGKTPKA